MKNDIAGETLTAWTAEVTAWCEEKGWNAQAVSFGEAMALLHSEASEALEAWRVWGLADNTAVLTYTDQDTGQYALAKPEGVGSEFADILIRLLDDCARFGVDLAAEVAEHIGQYGYSSSFAENIDHMHNLICRVSSAYEFAWDDDGAGYRYALGGVYVFLVQLCGLYDIPLAWEYERKMNFNRTREYRHGGKRM
jgi:hypothetical protein